MEIKMQSNWGYRPFKSIEEMVAMSSEDGTLEGMPKWVTHRLTGGAEMITGLLDGCNHPVRIGGNKWVNFMELAKNYCWADGTPCGVKK